MFHTLVIGSIRCYLTSTQGSEVVHFMIKFAGQPQIGWRILKATFQSTDDLLNKIGTVNINWIQITDI